MRVRAVATAVLLTCVTGAVGQAQGQNPVEMGIDGQASVGLSDQGTGISIPLQKIRAGFVIADAMTFEPALGFQRFSQDGFSFSNTALDLSLLYHFSASRAVRQLYLRPVFGLNLLSSSGAGVDDSETYLSLGIAGGIKVPLRDRFGARFEAEFRNQLENSPTPALRVLNLNIGLSYFTR